jgi:NADH dehydrogenase/NADH:ubiquinone oxidoreductase subunit G
VIETSINGKQYRFDTGMSVLDACRSAGIAIPTLCHDARLKPIGSCRMCLVDVDGKPDPVPACNTPLRDGMVISTHTAALENERRMVLKMLAQDRPGE